MATEVFRMKAANGGGLELRRFEDVIQPNMDELDPQRGTQFAKGFKYKSGDILMCTYPKCGSHWLINMMWKLIGTDSSERGMDTALELAQAEIYDAMPTPRVMMTHYKPSRLPTEHLQKKGKIVLMLRNPKDSMVSMYHHWKDAVLLHNTQTWDEFFQSYINGLTPCGSYFDYVQQWEQFLKEKPTDLHVEVFYYEDFKSNLNYNMSRLNHFLGFKRDQTYVDQVMKETTLSALKEQDASGKRGTIEIVRDENGDSVIFRKGEVGGWKNYLTVAQSEAVDKLMEERLQYGILNVKCEV